MEITTRIVELLAQKADLEAAEIRPDRTLGDIGLDSLHLTEIAMWMQREYGFAVPDGKLREDQTIREALDYLTTQPT